MHVSSRRQFIGAAAAVAGLGALAVAGASFDQRERLAETEVELAAGYTFPVGFSLGSNVLFGTQADIDATLDAILASGGTVVRIDIMWYFVQPTQSTYDWAMTDYIVDAARARNLQILAILLSSPPWAAYGYNPLPTARPRTADLYATFAASAAARYSGRISSFEIWNEPNGRMFFSPDPDAAFYTQMVRAAYIAIKGANPNATVVAGALGPTFDGDGTVHAINFLGQMYAAGLKGHFDALSFHPYEFEHPFSFGALYDNSPMRQMLQMHEMMTANNEGDKKIWITEYGAPTSVLSEQAQSDLLMASLREWTEVSYAGPFYIYTVRDANSDSNHTEDTFGVVRTDYTPKTAIWGVQALQSMGMPQREEGSVFSANADPVLGPPVLPVYALTAGFGQEHENGTRFLTNNGWFNSPPEVGRLARYWQYVPVGPFVNGRQDFDIPGGFRIFSQSSTGTHAVYGAILAAHTENLGFPTTDEYAYNGTASRAIDFENGRIIWSPTTGTEVVAY